MRYVIDLAQNQTDQIGRLVNARRYPSTAQFILTAVENQLYIEEDDKPSRPSPIKPANNNAKIHITEHEHDKVGSPVVDVNIVPSLTDIRNNKVKTIPGPNFEDLSCSMKRGKLLNEADAWLWGQVNRIFPVKLGLRILLASLGKEDTVELESFRTKAGEIALAYGKMLRSHERNEGRSREERVSAGLPIDIGDDEYRNSVAMKFRKNRQSEEIEAYMRQEEYKSTNRYRAHFLASMRKDEKLDGAMPYLRFVNLRKSEDGKIYIGLTSAGLDFAMLPNPIIDNKKFDASLAAKESEFYLEHISKSVKGELAAINWLLRKIDKGINKRERLNYELQTEMNKIWGDSDLVINTQRAGLMARMFELGLLGREKNGVEVTYEISTLGRKYLK